MVKQYGKQKSLEIGLSSSGPPHSCTGGCIFMVRQERVAQNVQLQFSWQNFRSLPPPFNPAIAKTAVQLQVHGQNEMATTQFRRINDVVCSFQ